MIQKFYKNLNAESKKATATIKSIERALKDAQAFLGDTKLQDATWDDILEYIEYISNEKEYSESSIALFKAKLRQFYIFCYEETDDSKYRKIIKNIKGQIKGKKILPQNLLIPSEVKRLINVANMEQDRAIISILYESGMRVGEFISLTNSMVQIDEQKQEVTFNIPDMEGCKTGARSVLCLEIYGYVQDWMKCHPKPSPEENFIQLKYLGIVGRIKKVFELAKIKKPTNPHMFRHAAITHSVILGMQQSSISMRFWGIPNSNMLAVYIHLSEQMQADEYKKAKGMNGDEPKVINPLASRCVKCGKLIKSGSLCEQCSESQGLKEELQKQHNLIIGILKIDWLKSDAQDQLKELYEAACSTMVDTKEFAKKKK